MREKGVIWVKIEQSRALRKFKHTPPNENLDRGFQYFYGPVPLAL